jgi:molecular chaperone GrpE (heat shock protein)
MPDDVSATEPPVEVPVECSDVPRDDSAQQQLLSSLDAVHADIAALREIVKERLTYDGVKEEAFDRLYAEVEEARQERSFQQLRPFLMDLILLYDRIELGMQQMQERTASLPAVVQLLRSFGDEVLEILYRREVEVLVVTSATFDRALQQAIKLQPTDRAAEHQQVLRVVRRGFRYRQRILRSEEVIVGIYQAGA